MDSSWPHPLAALNLMLMLKLIKLEYEK